MIDGVGLRGGIDADRLARLQDASDDAAVVGHAEFAALDAQGGPADQAMVGRDPRGRCWPDPPSTVAWPPRPSAPKAARSRASGSTGWQFPGSSPGGGSAGVADDAARTETKASRTTGNNDSSDARASGRRSTRPMQRPGPRTRRPGRRAGRRPNCPATGRPRDRGLRPAARPEGNVPIRLRPRRSNARRRQRPRRRSRRPVPSNRRQGRGKPIARLVGPIGGGKQFQRQIHSPGLSNI